MRRVDSWLVLLIVPAAMVGCSSSHPSSSAPSAPAAAATMISGTVVDAFVAGGSISAYQVTTAGTAGAVIAGPVTTDANGNYTLNLGTYTGPVLLESTGGTYVDPATGQTVNLANTGLTLMALVPSASGSITAQVTLVSTAAAQVALALIAGGDPVSTAATSANTAVGGYFGLPNLLTTALVDVTKSGCSSGAAQASIDYSLLLAGVAQLAMEYGVTQTNLELALLSDFLANGGFYGEADGVPITVPLIAGGSIALSTIEAGAAAQVASGALPGLEQAIQGFQSSGANACGATASTTQGQDLDAPSGGGQAVGVAIQIPVTVLGSETAAVSLPVSLDLTSPPAAGPDSATVSLSVTTGGSYYLHPGVIYQASSFTGNWAVNHFNSPSGETCTIGPSASGPWGSSVSGTFNTTTLVSSTALFLNCAAQTYSVTGEVNDLAADSQVTITDADTGQSTVITGNGSLQLPFTVDSGLANGTAYNITASTPCTVVDGSGTINGASFGSVSVDCGSGGGGITPVALANPNGLWYFDASDSTPYLLVANAGGANGGQVLVYSEQLSASNSVSGLTLVASITQGIDNPTRLFVDSNDHLYVTNFNNGSVTVYDLSNAANIAANTIPQITADTISTGLSNPLGIAVDLSNNNVYVANNGADTISVYKPAASGYTQISTLESDAAANAFDAPGALSSYSIGGQDYLLLGLGGQPGPDSVLLYVEPLTSAEPTVAYDIPTSASQTPLYKLSSSGSCAYGPSGPTAITLKQSGTPLIYVASFYSSTVQAYSVASFLPPDNSSSCPTPAFSSTATSGIAEPEGIAVDGFGNVFVSNSSANTVTVYGTGELADAPGYTQH